MQTATTQPAFLAALAVVRTLRAHGHQAFLAGGCVRDLLLSRIPKDYDVATSAEPSIVLDLFTRTFAVGAHFGVVLVSMEIDSHPTLTEVATFRSDGAYSDGRRPDAVHYTQSPEEDVQRRDFTINGLLLDPEVLAPKVLAPEVLYPEVLAAELPHPSSAEMPTAEPMRSFEQMQSFRAELAAGLLRRGTRFSPADHHPPSLRSAVIDHVNGLPDLDAGILRAIGNPALRFAEDHLRMLRAIRFAARFEFTINPATFAAIRSSATRIVEVSHERIRDELTRMLTEGHARRAFELLDASGLLLPILPEVHRLQGVEQPPQYHPEGDVWIHTLMLLDQLESGASSTLAWGALLHDIGKPATFTPPTHPGDRIRFNGHVEMGEAIATQILRRLRFSNEDTTQILALVHNHMRFGDVLQMKPSTLKRFFRLDRFPEHLALHHMDATASHGGLDNYHYAREQYQSMPEEEVHPKRLVTGRELAALGYRPGPQFKAILHAIEDAQLEGTLHTSEEAVAFIETHFPLHPEPASPTDPWPVP